MRYALSPSSIFVAGTILKFDTVDAECFRMDVCRILELLRELFRFTAVGMQNIMEPQNKEVVEYCLKLVGAKFVGETSNKVCS